MHSCRTLSPSSTLCPRRRLSELRVCGARRSFASRFGQLDVRPLRGNVETRLAKLDRGEYAAIVLAVAGLKRLGLEERIRAVIAPELSLPAAGQGALTIECRSSRADLVELLAPLHDHPTAACVRAERAVSRRLGGSCQVPLAAYGEIADGRLWLRGLVASPDGNPNCARARCDGDPAVPEEVGVGARRDVLLARGADEILALLR